MKGAFMRACICAAYMHVYVLVWLDGQSQIKH